MRTFAQTPQGSGNISVSSNPTLSFTQTPEGRHRVNGIPQLGRALGSHASGRKREAEGEGRDARFFRAGSSLAGHDFSRIPAYPSTRGTIQTKLTINTPGDKYEQEADRVAEQVMRTPDAAFNSGVSVGSGAGDSTVQRKCAECEKDEEKEVVRRSETPGAGSAGKNSSAPPIVGSVLRSQGRPLDAATRGFMEPRFNADFGNVRIHTDNPAATSAQAINAHAYTLGDRIVFNRGRYAPGTDEGRRLLAHELTHVMQQRNSSGAKMLQRQTPDAAQGGTPTETLGSTEANEICGPSCGGFPWFEVAPGRFLTLCDGTVQLSNPLVKTVGCPPGGSGNVVFVSGSPAWELKSDCSSCSSDAVKNKPMPKIEVGYIQTAKKVLSGGVYYKKNKAGKWEWSGNQWFCVSNARDGHPNSKEPWYGPDANGNFGPELYPGCSRLADNPFVKLPSHKEGGTLRRMRIDGEFQIWLIAKPASGPIVFLHFWDIKAWTVTELADDGEPCSVTAWDWIFNGTTVTASGPGKGSGTPVLTGKTANELKTDCSFKGKK